MLLILIVMMIELMREHASYKVPQASSHLGQHLAMTGFVGEAKGLKIYSGFYRESAWRKFDILCWVYLVLARQQPRESSQSQKSN